MNKKLSVVHAAKASGRSPNARDPGWRIQPEKHSGFACFGSSGIAFDVFATVVLSPNLAQEANPVARMLLDNGYSISTVYAYGGMMQFLVLAILCTMWAAFITHRQIYVESSYSQSSNSYLGFVKAMLGSGKKTWRQCFTPFYFKKSSPYHLLWCMVPLAFVTTAVHRWLLGLEWLGVFPSFDQDNFVYAVFPIAVSLTLLWMYFEFRQSQRRRATIAQDEPSDP